MTPGANRGGYGRSSIGKILLATDLSQVSGVATDLAFDLASRVGATLLAVSVIDPRDLLLPGGRFLARIDQVRERRETAAQELVQRGRRLDVPVTFLVWDGDPAESIVAAAQAERADLVVVGSHGRGTIGRLLLGSVSEYVVRNAPCPVLVARTGPQAASLSGRADRQANSLGRAESGGMIDNGGPLAAAIGDPTQP